MVGDRSKDAIVHLYYIMSSMDVKQNKSVLWAYKNKLLGFTSHRQKRENKIKKEIKRGTREANSEDPFELFISLHDIRYVYYKETDKILGNTYGMVRWRAPTLSQRLVGKERVWGTGEADRPCENSASSRISRP